MAKQKYYRLDKILKTDAQYYLLLGERSNGKSYAVKEYALRQAWNEGKMLVYLRRWQLETKTEMVESYFSDSPISAITGGECSCVSVYRGEIYASNVDDEGKIVRVRKLGRTMYLSGETHYKSMSMKDFENIVFEEVITDSGYLFDEVNKLMSLVSTIARRRAIKVFLIGNTISRLCPYFSEWGLRNIPKMQAGDIETYDFSTSQIDDDGNAVTVRIAVEFCENSGKNSKMFFGQSTDMITTGAWQTKEYPHLRGRLKDYTELYRARFEHSGLAVNAVLLCGDDNVFVYCYPATKDRQKNQRIIGDLFDLSILYTEKMTSITKGDKLLFALINLNKVVFSDNLTGSDFFNILNAL
jgi:hypothetical protein